MSYRGRPSKGCESCRSRKVKCDETKPVCSRCSKTGHECKYRDPADLLFRNQTASAAQKAEDNWRQRAKSSQRVSGESSKQTSNPSSSKSHSSSGASPPQGYDFEALQDFNNLTLTTSAIQPDLRQLAYERFMYDFVIFDPPGFDHTKGPSDAFMDFVPALYDSASEGSCIRTIAEAVFYANFYSRCNAPKARVLAEETVGKGLKMLQARIADKQLAPTDETLASANLMGVYENLTSPVRDGGFIAHKDGANALLKLRSIEQYFSNPISSRLFETATAQMLIATFNDANKWAQLIGNLNAAEEPTASEQQVHDARQVAPGRLYGQPSIYMRTLVNDGARLHARWYKLKHGSNPPMEREAIHDLLRKALDLDAEYQAWEASVPPNWRPKIHRNTPELRSAYNSQWVDVILGSDGAPRELYEYESLKRSYVWMFYRSSRLYLLRDTIEMLNWALRLPEPIEPQGLPEQQTTGLPTRTPLDTISLQIHHTFATSHLVDVIEKNCSTGAGHFMVPIPGKSFQDLPGLRGYTSFWALGVMDGVFRIRALPDTSQPTTATGSPEGYAQLPMIDPSIMQAQPPPQGQYHLHPYPSPAMFKFPDEAVSPFYHDPATAVPHPDDFPRLDPIAAPPPASSQPRISATPLPQPIPPPPLYSGKVAFDLAEPHPWDYPPENLPPLDVNFANPPAIDATKRRAWMHRVIYYSATELGIRKGLAVVTMEGYLEQMKAEVESLLGKAASPLQFSPLQGYMDFSLNVDDLG